jgi:hypothetical protein
MHTPIGTKKASQQETFNSMLLAARNTLNQDQELVKDELSRYRLKAHASGFQSHSLYEVYLHQVKMLEKMMASSINKTVDIEKGYDTLDVALFYQQLAHTCRAERIRVNKIQRAANVAKNVGIAATILGIAMLLGSLGSYAVALAWYVVPAIVALSGIVLNIISTWKKQDNNWKSRSNGYIRSLFNESNNLPKSLDAAISNASKNRLQQDIIIGGFKELGHEVLAKRIYNEEELEMESRKELPNDGAYLIPLMIKLEPQFANDDAYCLIRVKPKKGQSYNSFNEDIRQVLKKGFEWDEDPLNIHRETYPHMLYTGDIHADIKGTYVYNTKIFYIKDSFLRMKLRDTLGSLVVTKEQYEKDMEKKMENTDESIPKKDVGRDALMAYQHSRRPKMKKLSEENKRPVNRRKSVTH